MNGVITVKIDGKTHDELSKGCVLRKVDVDQRLNDHWRTEIEIRQTEDERFPLEECIGKDLVITAADKAGSPYTLFEGVVEEGELVFEVYGSFTACLWGVTKSVRLAKRMRHKYFRKKNMEDVAKELTADHGLKSEVKEVSAKGWDPGRKLNYCQWDQSDFDFIKEQADYNWAWVRPTKDGVEIRGAFDKGVKLGWRGVEGLLRFSLRGKLGEPYFEGSHYDIRAREVALHEKVEKEPEYYSPAEKLRNAVKDQSQKNLSPTALAVEKRAPSPAEFEQLLEKEAVRSLASKITGRGVSRHPGVRAGDEVEIEKHGELDGTYGVTSVKHKWTPAGFENEFECTVWKSWCSPERPPRHVMNGVIPATIIQHNDPRRMGRVQIQYEWMDGMETAWARMTSLHAGGGRGMIFMPEIGDEVLVAFEQGDCERPYVIGSLWNGHNTQPEEGFRDDLDQTKEGAKNEDLTENYIKRIVTKCGAGMYFNDKPDNEAIAFHVPGDMHLFMTHNNPESPGRPLMLLHNEKGDIVLSAPNGRIHTHSKWKSDEIGQ